MILATIIYIATITALSVAWVNCIDNDIKYRQEHPDYNPDDDDIWPPINNGAK